LHRLSRLLVLVCLMALVSPAVAGAAERMYLGFQDDVSFRWAPGRASALDRARDAGATVVRTTLYWYQVAVERPANPADPFDPAYKFDDVDELVRGAQERGIEVMLTIWGTPAWANGGQGPNFLPAQLSDATAFAKAVATRYSGHFIGFPHVRFYTIWNESNLQQFLSPQFDAKGKSVGPGLYAKLYRAFYAGIKAGNKKALVGVGETSPRGRDKPSPGTAQDSHTPGRFAELVAKARPKVKFDAWAHHPYPTAPNLPPKQRVRWPNVNLPMLPRFEESLERWFGRPVPIWITEYGHETRPEEPLGVSRSAQAAYLKQALGIARADKNVQLFIWFILRDDFSTAISWQSGLYDLGWTPKPALASVRPIARSVDARNRIYTVPAGTSRPVVSLAALEIRARSDVGALVGINYTIADNGKFVGNAIASGPIDLFGYVTFRPEITVSKGHRYTLGVTMTDVHGTAAVRTVEIVAR